MPIGKIDRLVIPATTPRGEVPFAKTPVAAAVADVVKNVEAEGGGILKAIGHTSFGRAMMGAAGAISVLSPMVRPVIEAHAEAPVRLAPDARTSVNFLQARAESALRAKLLAGADKATIDDVGALVTAVDKGHMHGQRGLELAQEIKHKRGYTAEALAAVTDYFSARAATMAAPLKTDADSVVVAPMRGGLVHDNAAYTDVRQGAVGDCYFAASAAAIVARDPSFPHRIIEARTSMDGDRFYAVTLSRNLLNLPQGSYTLEVQDAVWSKDGNDHYAQNVAGHWFQVLEQAGAKLDGDFDRLESGFGFEGMSRLTGLTAGYSFFYAGADREAVFANVKQHFAAGHAMTTGSHDFADKAFVDKHPHDFATLHEYAIVDVTGTSASDGVVTLYNPWGYTFTVSVEELTRNFLGFSFLDLSQEKIPVKLMPEPSAIVRKQEDLVVVVERPVAAGNADPTV